MKKLIVTFIFLLVAAPIFSLALATPAAAQADLDPWGAYSGGEINEDTLAGLTGLGREDPRNIAARVINIILGFLGIIAVILILIGGFMWMTAAGNEDKVASAKSVMMAGVIGLVIVLAAFGIARFVVDALVDVTTTAP